MDGVVPLVHVAAIRPPPPNPYAADDAFIPFAEAVPAPDNVVPAASQIEPPEPAPVPVRPFAESVPSIVIAPVEASKIAPPPAPLKPADPKSVGATTEPYVLPGDPLPGPPVPP